MKNALKKLDDSELNGRRIRLKIVRTFVVLVLPLSDELYLNNYCELAEECTKQEIPCSQFTTVFSITYKQICSRLLACVKFQFSCVQFQSVLALCCLAYGKSSQWCVNWCRV